MLQAFKNGQGSVVLRAKLLDSGSTTGAGLTGLTSASAGLLVSTLADSEAAATAYSAAGATLESITTLGTYAAPTATKCRFREVDATNHPGLYEFQFADARFAVANAKSLIVSVSGAGNLQQADFLVQLQSDDPYLAKPANFSALAITGGGAVTAGTVGDKTGYALASAPPSSATIAAAVWDLTLAGHTGTGSTGAALNAAGAAGDPWSTALPGTYGAGTAGKIVGDNVNATIASRLPTSSYVVADNTGIAAIKAKTDNLPASPAATGAAMTLTAGERSSIASRNWDEAQSGHATAGTFGKFLDTAVSGVGGGATPSVIAGAVWDEARTAHTTAGSFGQGVAGVQGNVTGSVGAVTNPVTVGTNTDKTGYGLSGAAVQAIWDAATSALTTAGSVGKRIADFLTGDAFARLGAPAGASVSADVAAVKAQTAAVQGDTGTAIPATLATIASYVDTEVAAIKAKTDNLPASPAATSDIPSAASVATAVWDATRAAHTGAGSFGQGVSSVQGAVTGSVASVTATVTVGTNNDKTGYGLSAAAVQAVWDAASSALTTVGSIGARIVAFLTGDAYARLGAPAGSNVSADIAAVKADSAAIKLKTDTLPASPAATSDVPSAATVAGAVWNEARSGHTTAGSFGQGVSSVQGAVASVTATVTVGTNNDKTGYGLSAAAIQAVWDAATSALTTAGSIGARIVAFLTGDIYARLGAPAGANVSADIAAVKADSAAIKLKTDTLPGSPAATSDIPSAATVAGAVWNEARAGHTTAGSFGQGVASVQGAVTGSVASVTGSVGGSVASVTGSVGGSVASVTGAVTVGTNQDKTGYGLSAAAVQAVWDAATSALATVGSIGKRLADFVTGDAFARLGAPAGGTVSADIAAVKTDTAAIKAKTDNLPATPAASGDVMTLTSGERTSIADATLKRDFALVSGEAPRSLLNAARALRNKVDVDNTGLFTVRKEDDVSTAWTGTVTTTAGADPITAMDPS